MQEVMRIFDNDERSLSARVEAALARLGGLLVVSRFTLWYTTRPPVHHAVLRAEAPAELSGFRSG
jgi:D-Tyr-tRNAtyr deacylase